MKLLVILSLLVLASCQQKETPANTSDEHDPIHADTETCAACGMVVREQPAPRGQVIHRNGDRKFLCSIDDLLQYLALPSPSGKPAHVFCEVMPDAHALNDMNASFQTWKEASTLSYVVGVERSGVMGDPVMSYASTEAAEIAAEKFGGKVLTFEQLKTQTHK